MPKVKVVALALLYALLIAACGPAPVSSPTPKAAPPATPAFAEPVAVPAGSWQRGALEIHVLDVAHGDAQLIVSPTGESLLIDGGRAEFASHVAGYLTGVLGTTEVDYLLATHYHVDHIQGIPPLVRLQGLRVRRNVYDRGGDRDEYDSDHYRSYFDLLGNKQYGLKRITLKVGDEIDMGPQLSVRVLAAGDSETNTAFGVPGIDDNDLSIALWLRFGRFDYWTGGDLSGVDSSRFINVESAVIPRLPGPADVYRVNHHAVDYNSNAEFLAALSPTVSLVSGSNDVIRWNALVRVEKLSKVYITGEVPAHRAYGDIVLRSTDGDSYTVEGDDYRSK